LGVALRTFIRRVLYTAEKVRRLLERTPLAYQGVLPRTEQEVSRVLYSAHVQRVVLQLFFHRLASLIVGAATSILFVLNKAASIAALAAASFLATPLVSLTGFGSGVALVI
jgi:hypothetical protein